MEQDVKPSSESKTDPAVKAASVFVQVKRDYRWKVFAQSAFITLTSIFLFGGVGWLIDTWFVGKGHAFFIALLIISYPVTQIALHRRMRNFKLPKINQ